MGVTIADIAAAASVSKSTVSRAFARPGSVNDDTRRRIFAVASQLGYSPPGPSPASRPASSGQIGLFIPDIANPFYPPLIKAVQIAGRRLGIEMLVRRQDHQAILEEPHVSRLGAAFVRAGQGVPADKAAATRQLSRQGSHDRSFDAANIGEIGRASCRERVYGLV